MSATLHPSAYRAPAWLPDGHSQTIYPALCLGGARPAYLRERWATPDGGEITVDRLPGRQGMPLLWLLHGLEGGSDSHYARALMRAAQARGWHGVVSHFRGCGGAVNTLPRAYHAGDSAEVAWLLARLASEGRPVCAVGVSLGGNMLLKHLGGGKFTYAGAHESILIYRRATHQVDTLPTDGTWLGLQDDIGAFLEELARGDVVWRPFELPALNEIKELLDIVRK